MDWNYEFNTKKRTTQHSSSFSFVVLHQLWRLQPAAQDTSRRPVAVKDHVTELWSAHTCLRVGPTHALKHTQANAYISIYSDTTLRCRNLRMHTRHSCAQTAPAFMHVSMLWKNDSVSHITTRNKAVSSGVCRKSTTLATFFGCWWKHTIGFH